MSDAGEPHIDEPAVDVLFVLRGRPGLGHVLPGLAIADRMARGGRTVGLMTYSNGWEFIRDAALHPNIVMRRELPIRPEYQDWPGLDIYDHGVRAIAPVLEKSRVRLVVFGGEYTHAIVGASYGTASAMLFNPEIMEDNPRNRMPSTLFCRLFGLCDRLVPMEPLSPDADWLPDFLPLKDRLTTAGPFRFAGQAIETSGRLFLVANGGGVSFPKVTTSYSSSLSSSAAWLDQTKQMTRDAVRIIAGSMAPDDELHVFSALTAVDNTVLADGISGSARVTWHRPSLSYYDHLAAADLVVSRGGSGFLADIEHSEVPAIVWTLEGHDEQRQKVRKITAERPGTWHVEGSEDLAAAVAAALARPPVMRSATGTDDRAAQVAEELVGLWHIPNVPAGGLA